MKIQGIKASNGIVIAPVYKLSGQGLVVEEKTCQDVDNEIFRFHEAIEICQNDLEEIS